jgi:hypothetical protein
MKWKISIANQSVKGTYVLELIDTPKVMELILVPDFLLVPNSLHDPKELAGCAVLVSVGKILKIMR